MIFDKKRVAQLAVLAIAVSANAAFADTALPDWATQAISDASAKALAVFAVVGPVIGVVFGSEIVVKLFKRAGRKI